MTFSEWANQHGYEAALKAFRIPRFSHGVFVVRPGRFVSLTVGPWHGSEPLGNGQPVESAKSRLRRAVCHCFQTEETIVDK
jgi:hypothetical protein